MASRILQQVYVGLSTKDSIQIVWTVSDDLSALVRGFKVRYQAVGSTVVQYSHMLGPSTHSHDITKLHENTAYEICVRVFATLSPGDSSADGHLVELSSPHDAREADSGCITGSTAIDALRVAVGSTLGAFIALGVVVAFVLIAKCQHSRHRRCGVSGGSSSSCGKMLRLSESDEASLNDDEDNVDDGPTMIVASPGAKKTNPGVCSATSDQVTESPPPGYKVSVRRWQHDKVILLPVGDDDGRAMYSPATVEQAGQPDVMASPLVRYELSPGNPVFSFDLVAETDHRPQRPRSGPTESRFTALPRRADSLPPQQPSQNVSHAASCPADDRCPATRSPYPSFQRLSALGLGNRVAPIDDERLLTSVGPPSTVWNAASTFCVVSPSAAHGRSQPDLKTIGADDERADGTEAGAELTGLVAANGGVVHVDAVSEYGGDTTRLLSTGREGGNGFCGLRPNHSSLW